MLKALKILGLEEMHKLASFHQTKKIQFKKAAGEELILWDDLPELPYESTKKNEATVLPFPKTTTHQTEGVKPGPTEHAQSSAENVACMPVDILLWQRDVVRHTGENNQKLDAFKGYKKASEMYVVKSLDEDGKDRIRFASTNGVLVNKKQG